MRGKRIICSTAILIIGIASFCAGRSLGSSRPQLEPTARCTIVVPKQWGEYIGAGSYGLEFKDDSGTVRFVKQFPVAWKVLQMSALRFTGNSVLEARGNENVRSGAE